MKKNLGLLSILLLAVVFNANAQTTTYGFTGGVQTYTVPPGVISLGIDIKGGSGGQSTYYSPGGCGGQVVCTLAVTPGQVLNIYVGGMGSDGSFFTPGTGGTTGPFLSGGDGGSWYAGGGGGGGATDIRIGGTALTDRVIAAGGGGGGGDNCGSDDGGSGGGSGTAGDGIDCGSYFSGTCGAGATPLAGGAGASSGGAGSGVALVGGTGSAYYFQSGGGGGGGYFGGGGGYNGGGGGGSSFANTTLTSAVVHTAGANCSSDGSATITVLCVIPVGGAIVGPTTLCVGSTVTYTNPTGTTGGTWSSSAPGVASINPTTGAVTALATGSTTLKYLISLSCGADSVFYPVTVISTAAPVTGDSFVCVGDADTFFNSTPGGTWGSSASGVATIDPVTGIISTVGPGTTTISYTVGVCSSTTVLTVNPLPAPIAGPNAVCKLLTITLTDADPGGTWSSSVPAAATVDPSTGVVTGANIGGTNIYYTLPTGCVSLNHFVSVSQPPLPITGPNQVCVGNAIILNELVGGGSWSSSAPLNASVSSGVVTGLNPSTVTISYTMPSCPPATHVVTVNPLPAPITGPTAVCVGATTTLHDATPGGSWASSDPAVVINSAGDVTSSTSGISATIYYILPTTCFVTEVVNVSIPPSSIVGADSICQGDTTLLTNTTTGGIWSSTNLAIAQVIASTGVVSGISGGLVNISYTLPTGCFAFKPFLVNPPVDGSVILTSTPGGIICEGTPVTFTATPVNGGVPTYIWKKFSVAVDTVVDSTGTYVDSPAVHGDAIMCFMIPHGVCALRDTVADTIVLNIYPNNVIPSVVISTTGPDTIAYVGQVVTFFSVVTYGGTTQTYQWYRNSAPIPGANSSSYSTPVYASDTFYCEVHGNPPCSDTLPVPPGISNKIIIHDYLAVSSVSNGTDDLSLFPNPNNGSFTLSGKLAVASATEVKYEVSNMLGQVIYNGTATPDKGKINARINVGNIVPGTYLLRINTESGSQTFHFIIGK